MARSIVAALAALVFTAAAYSQGGAPADVAPLAGAWSVTAAEQAGKPFDVIVGGVLKIDGDSFALRTAKGTELTGKLRVDTAASPKQLDFLLSTGAVWEAIYTVSGDLFRLNYVEKGDAPRPTVFATTADTPGTVIVMRKGAPQ